MIKRRSYGKAVIEKFFQMESSTNKIIFKVSGSKRRISYIEEWLVNGKTVSTEQLAEWMAIGGTELNK